MYLNDLRKLSEKANMFAMLAAEEAIARGRPPRAFSASTWRGAACAVGGGAPEPSVLGALRSAGVSRLSTRPQWQSSRKARLHSMEAARFDRSCDRSRTPRSMPCNTRHHSSGAPSLATLVQMLTAPRARPWNGASRAIKLK